MDLGKNGISVDANKSIGKQPPECEVMQKRSNIELDCESLKEDSMKALSENVSTPDSTERVQRTRIKNGLGKLETLEQDLNQANAHLSENLASEKTQKCRDHNSFTFGNAFIMCKFY